MLGRENTSLRILIDVTEKYRNETADQLAQAMKEIRQHLLELQHFLAQQEAAKTINKIQYTAYVDQTNRLALQMSVDAHLFQAKQAQQIGKLRLAIHFFLLAKKMLAAENATRTYDKQIVQLDGIIAKLEEKAQIRGETPEAAPSATQSKPNSKEWENFAPPDEKWKKKQIYD